MANKQGCSNVKIDEEVSFSVVVKVEECKPEEADNSYSFNIEVTDICVSQFTSYCFQFTSLLSPSPADTQGL